MIFLTKAALHAEIERVIQEREYHQHRAERSRYQIVRVAYGCEKPQIVVRDQVASPNFGGTVFSSVIEDSLAGILTRILRAIEASGIEIRIVTHGPDTIEFHKKDSA